MNLSIRYKEWKFHLGYNFPSSLFSSLSDLQKKEIELKSIPGVPEVGLFTRHADVYYKAMHNGSFDIIKF